MPGKGKAKSRLSFGYGAIYQRKTKQGNIRWYLDYRNKDAKRVREVVPSAITAQDAGNALRERIMKALYGEAAVQKKTGFEEFAEVYLNDHIKVKRRNWHVI